MNADTGQIPEFDEGPEAGRRSTPGPTVREGSAAKQSFERSPDVQRWLWEQAREDQGNADAGAAFEFDPAHLAGRRDRDWILSSLARFHEEGLISDVLHVASSGKEATVYCCADGPGAPAGGPGAAWLAAKVYRPRMFRSLRNDAVYRGSRAMHDERGRPLRDRRRQRGGERGRANQVAHWIDYEFRTQQLLHAAGADVPRPLSQIGNATLMEYIGDLDEPAPALRQVALTPEEARPLFERLLWNVELFLACDRIHGDLSAYNILYWEGAATIIDFAQAIDPRHNAEVYPLLERDIDRLCRYFARYGVAADAGALAADLWVRYMGGVL